MSVQAWNRLCFSNVCLCSFCSTHTCSNGGSCKPELQARVAEPFGSLSGLNDLAITLTNRLARIRTRLVQRERFSANNRLSSSLIFSIVLANQPVCKQIRMLAPGAVWCEYQCLSVLTSGTCINDNVQYDTVSCMFVRNSNPRFAFQNHYVRPAAVQVLDSSICSRIGIWQRKQCSIRLHLLDQSSSNKFSIQVVLFKNLF